MPASSRRKSASKAPAKYSETEIKTVTETPTTPPNPGPPSPPGAPKLTWGDYSEDFKVRLAIHNYEVNALLVDVKKAYEFASPYVKQATNYTVKTFNQVREKLQTAD